MDERQTTAYWSVARFSRRNRRRDSFQSLSSYTVWSPDQLSVGDDVLVKRSDGTSKTVRILDSGKPSQKHCTDGRVNGWDYSFANLHSARASGIAGVVEILPSFPGDKPVERRRKRRQSRAHSRAKAIKPPPKRCHGGMTERDASASASRTPGGEPYECPYGDHWHVRAG